MSITYGTEVTVSHMVVMEDTLSESKKDSYPFCCMSVSIKL